MKGSARKIGRPPPGDPPVPAADTLVPDTGDIGSFGSGALLLGGRRGAALAFRGSCRVRVDAPLTAAPGLAVTAPSIP